MENIEALAQHAGERPAVLVLGGSSFMGRALLEQLLAKPARVCMVNRGRKHWGTDDPSGGRVARVRADRRDKQGFAAGIDEATRHLGGQPWDLVADFSAFDTEDMRCSMAGLKGRFKMYAYISSDSIYEVCRWAASGWTPQPGVETQIVTEPMCLRPKEASERKRLKKADDYGHGKLECEEALVEGLAEAPNSFGVALRLPDVLGPYDETLRLWAWWHWLRAASERSSVPPLQVQRTTGAEEPSAKRRKEAIPEDPALAFVFNQDVARFIVNLIGREPASRSEPLAVAAGTAAAGRFDAVNLGCSEQLALPGFLATLSAASGFGEPRLTPVPRPKTYLPSVDRPWPLDMRHLKEGYSFEATPLKEVLSTTATWFAAACQDFPSEARRAASKLPKGAKEVAFEIAKLKPLESSSSSDGSSSS